MLLKKIASFLKGTILVQLIANINEISYPLKKNIYIYIYNAAQECLFELF